MAERLLLPVAKAGIKVSRPRADRTPDGLAGCKLRRQGCVEHILEPCGGQIIEYDLPDRLEHAKEAAISKAVSERDHGFDRRTAAVRDGGDCGRSAERC
jgi:hypothetical protein